MFAHLRLILRLPALLMLTLVGLSAALLLFPLRLLSARIHLASLAPFQLGFMRLTCLLLGIRVAGTVPRQWLRESSLVIANHQGYLDIPILGARIAGHFVSKAGVRQWPLMGLLATAGGTLFVNRTLPKRRRAQLGLIGQTLGAGVKVIGFPEGTTSDGAGVLPLRTGLFQAAIESGATVLPVAIEYRNPDGTPIAESERTTRAWVGDDPVVPHMLQFMRSPGLRALLRVGAPIRPPHTDRRSLAAKTQTRLLALYAEPLPGPSPADPSPV